MLSVACQVELHKPCLNRFPVLAWFGMQNVPTKNVGPILLIKSEGKEIE